jgi:nicotinate phosphoribosyltransferase
MLELLREVRWELDLRGYGHVKLIVSGGLDEQDLRELNEVADGYGVGTAISNAPVVNFAMDLVEIDGRPSTKRGKLSGHKRLWVCPACGARTVLPAAQPTPTCACGGEAVLTTQVLLRGGEVATPLPSVLEIKAYCTAQVRSFRSARPE